jgi:hypothetical protein
MQAMATIYASMVKGSTERKSVNKAIREEAKRSGKEELKYNACLAYLGAQEQKQSHAGNWIKEKVMGKEEEEGVGVT